MGTYRPIIQDGSDLEALQQGDYIERNPQPLQFTYNSVGLLETITAPGGVRTFTYVDNKLDTISDTEAGTLQTFSYDTGKLTGIEITNL